MTERGLPVGAAGAEKNRHVPVLLSQVIEALAPANGEILLDATFGRGGYTRAILAAAPACKVIALDRDPTAIVAAEALARENPEQVIPIRGRFGELAALVRERGLRDIDAVVMDLGVSSPQLDDPERGFSFQTDGPLDMRMGREGPTAAELLNGAEETQIADALHTLGEEKRARAIARAIVRQRSEAPLQRTGDLVRAVERVLGSRKIEGKHPATRTFQAVRLWVNDELGELKAALDQSLEVLKPEGRLVVVTFHSLEDRIVKRFLAEAAGRRPSGSRHLPEQRDVPSPCLRLVNPRGVTPDEDEIRLNPRARSARLRAAIRTAAAPRAIAQNL